MERKPDRSAGPTRARRSDLGGPLPPGFYDRGAEVVARDLLGCLLISTVGGVRAEGEIVETEAYTGPDDEASHAHRRFGRTRRNEVMFGAPATSYVYRIYGLHWCLNAVTGPEGYPAAVLIRALAPLGALDVPRARRPGRPDPDLMRGPGNVCQALAVDGSLNGHPLLSAPLWIEPGCSYEDEDVESGPRVGISRATELALRFRVRGSPFTSLFRPR